MLDWAGMLAGGGQLLGGIAGLLGGNDDAKDAAIINRNLQQRAMTKSIQYRVQDAIKAGIHPLYAVGAPTFSPASSYVGDSGVDRGNAIANMGQGIGRAVEAMQSTEKRHASRMLALTEQRAELENTLLAAQIRLATQPGQPPGFPSPNGTLIPGQGNLVEVNPSQQTTSMPGAPHHQPGTPPEVRLFRTRDGYSVLPSSDAKQAMEDQLLPEIQWAIRNSIVPTVRPTDKLHPSKEWHWDPYSGEWKVRNITGYVGKKLNRFRDYVGKFRFGRD